MLEMKPGYARTMLYPEKRSEPRRAAAIFVKVHLQTQGVSGQAATVIPGLISDVSEHGLGLSLPVALEKGVLIRLELDGGAQSVPECVWVAASGAGMAVVRAYEVMRCQPIRGGLYSVGVRKPE